MTICTYIKFKLKRNFIKIKHRVPGYYTSGLSVSRMQKHDATPGVSRIIIGLSEISGRPPEVIVNNTHKEHHKCQLHVTFQ